MNNNSVSPSEHKANRNEAKNIIKLMIDSISIDNFLLAYQEKTGKDLLLDLYKSGLEESVSQIASNVSTNLNRWTGVSLNSDMRNALNSEDKKINTYIAEGLFNSIYHNGKESKLLPYYLLMINENNAQDIITKYQKNVSELRKNLEASSIQNLPFGEKIIENFAPNETLMKAVLDEFSWGEDKNMFIKNFLTRIFNSESTVPLNNEIMKLFSDKEIADFYRKDNSKYTSDIIEDLASHKTDTTKMIIDIKRLVNREEGVKENKVTLDGVFDTGIFQGLTGDCWLLAGLISIIEHPKMGKNTLSNSIL